MYVPHRYEEKDKDVLRAFVRENSFAILVSVLDGRPLATHIPLLLEKDAEGRDILMGHISRGNEQKHTLSEGARVLAIFPGPHAYISPRWYTEMNVPTWNYISIHLYGTVSIIEGEALRRALVRLVGNYEHSLPQPVQMEEIPEKTFEDNFRGIVGFSILIEEWQAAYKLSQNRDAASYRQVVGQLEQGDVAARAVAEEMKKRNNP